jgi:SAM-dependent methyltransferase
MSISRYTREKIMTFISAAPEHLSYYDLQLGHPDWERATVLDFGGNRGNALMAGRIKESNYWCVDVSLDAIDQGRRDYPEAHWIFYNRYNFHFNPTGIPGLPIPLKGRSFDYILAYSVFTHTSKAEMIELVADLRALLVESGKLAFTFIDPHLVLPRDYSSLLREHDPPTNLGLRLEVIKKQRSSSLPVQQRLREAAGCDWCTLINDGDLYVGLEDTIDHAAQTKTLYDTFCTVARMRQIFPEGTILASPEEYDPQGREMQHCCILGPNKHSGLKAQPREEILYARRSIKK